MSNEIIIGDVLDPATWSGIPDGSVHCVVTSPPYWGLRSYGGWNMCSVFGSLSEFVLPRKHPERWLVRMKVRAIARGGIESPNGKAWIGCLGLEDTPERFIEHMVAVFRHVWRVLRDDGTLWLNLGDSYAGSTNTGGTKSIQGSRKRVGAMNEHNRTLPPGLKPKDLCGIPWRVALALQADGWYLRQDIIWAKPNPMPESCRDRCTKAHEYIFLLTKRPRYFYDAEAVKEAAAYAGQQRGGSTKRYEQNESGMDNKVYNTRNKRSVWTVCTEPYSEAHFATFPPKLIEPCILTGTSAKGCCPECGAPWKRVVESVKHFESGSGKSGNPIVGKNGPKCQGGGDTGDIRKGPVVESRTIGWEPGCVCIADSPTGVVGPPVPCIVLDPFMGSGTTGMVAKQHDRDWLGIELNPEYADMALDRIAKATEAGYVAQDIPDDSTLFE